MLSVSLNQPINVVSSEDEPETLIHLFLQCSLTKQFWQNVLNWINTQPGHENVELSENMLLGLANCKTVILHLLIPIARYCIFLSKTRKKSPNLTAYKEGVKYFYYKEKEIPFQQGKRVEFFVYDSSLECFLFFSFLSPSAILYSCIFLVKVNVTTTECK